MFWFFPILVIMVVESQPPPPPEPPWWEDNPVACGEVICTNPPIYVAPDGTETWM
jgi:hypothetical protein